VLSAGVTPVSMFEDTFEVNNFSPAMVIISTLSGTQIATSFQHLIYFVCVSALIGYKLLGVGICNIFCGSTLEDDKREDCGDRIFG
jgi:hypothetical protein